MLIIEDETTQRGLLTGVLERGGYQVLAFTDGELGLRAIVEYVPHLGPVFLDEFERDGQGVPPPVTLPTLVHSNRSLRLAPEAYTAQPPGRLKTLFIRHALRFLIRCYLRVRAEGLEHVPAKPPYLLNFSHPNWVDPFLVVAFWPKHQRVFIFGPKEEDMATGWRNLVIGWGQLAVPFKPSKSDLIDTTKRAMSVLKAGYVLGIAGEGRLSDREGAIVPLQDGAAFFALRGRVPVVPMAIIGTRWLRFGKQVTLRVGPPLSTEGLRPDRPGVVLLTERLETAMGDLLAGVEDERPPGPFGRWLTDIFNERPWLKEQQEQDRERESGAG